MVYKVMTWAVCHNCVYSLGYLVMCSQKFLYRHLRLYISANIMITVFDLISGQLCYLFFKF